MWTTNENATTQVEYGLTTSYGQNSTLVTTLSASHSMLISGLNPSTTYHYRVRSSDAAGNTSISQDYTFSTLSLPDTTAPNQITQVSVSEIGQSSARIAWPSASDNIGIIGYDLRWSTSLITQGNFFSATRVQALLIVPVSGTIQQYYISTGLTPATTYYFSVVAYDAAGNVSVISNVGTVTTQSAPTTQNPTPSTDPGTVSVPNTASGGGGGGGGGAGYTVYQLTDTIPPSTPGTAVGTALDGQAVLQWQNPTDSDFVRVVVRRSTVGFPAGRTDGDLVYEGSGTTYTDVHLNNDQPYYYSIFAYDRSSNYTVPVPLAVTPKAGAQQRNISVFTGDPDTDGDGLTDILEDAHGTDIFASDTDGDGYSDKTEIDSGNDPLNSPGKTNSRLVNRVKGKILLQVQRNGEAWYVNPADGKRYYLRNGAFAYQIMRKLSLGITDKDLAKIPTMTFDNKQLTVDKKLVNRLKGRILLQVQQYGEAWYVNPADGIRYYMKDGDTAYQMMRKFGLGAKTSDIIQVPYSRIK